MRRLALLFSLATGCVVGAPQTVVHLASAQSGLSTEAFAEVVECVQRAYRAFDVRLVVATDGGQHLTLLFGGAGDGEDHHGRAPLGGRVGHVFTDNLGENVSQICSVAVHELAHMFGVDHAMVPSEPTSYLPFDGERVFVDVEAPCGESIARTCADGRATQNSFRILEARLGLVQTSDGDAPAVELGAAAGSRGSIAIRVRATDASGIGIVMLHYRDGARELIATCGDGAVACTGRADDYTFVIPQPTGRATFHAEAVDSLGNRAVSQVLEHDPS